LCPPPTVSCDRSCAADRTACQASRIAIGNGSAEQMFGEKQQIPPKQQSD